MNYTLVFDSDDKKTHAEKFIVALDDLEALETAVLMTTRLKKRNCKGLYVLYRDDWSLVPGQDVLQK